MEFCTFGTPTRKRSDHLASNRPFRVLHLIPAAELKQALSQLSVFAFESFQGFSKFSVCTLRICLGLAAWRLSEVWIRSTIRLQKIFALYIGLLFRVVWCLRDMRCTCVVFRSRRWSALGIGWDFSGRAPLRMSWVLRWHCLRVESRISV
jgi:hypothetical protein